MARLIYICSPLRSYMRGAERVGVSENIEAARRHSRTTALLGHFPLAPHLLLTQFLDDGAPAERQLGLRLGLDVLEKCDAVWVFGDYLSSGMRGEIAHAFERKIPVAWWRNNVPWVGDADRSSELPAALAKSLLTTDNCGTVPGRSDSVSAPGSASEGGARG